MSVGDSMTFFYRRVPPQSRRKSGIQIVVDESAALNCKDGDTAHNRYSRIIPTIMSWLSVQFYASSKNLSQHVLLLPSLEGIPPLSGFLATFMYVCIEGWLVLFTG